MSRHEIVAERKRRAIELLRELGAVPNVPFREHGVLAILRRELEALGITASSDRWGNLYGRYQQGRPSRPGQPVALVAHTDHPAFEIAELVSGDPSGSIVRATMLGRVWVEHFAGPVPVRVYAESGVVSGTIERAVETEAGIDLYVRTDSPVAPGDPGVWDLPDFVLDGPFIRMRAVDDLGGCAVIVQTLREVVTAGIAVDVTALFTRAEEVSLVGATLAAKHRTLPPETLVISLETSRALPGAEQGRGPVIRVGDVRRSFHPEGEALLLAARQRLEALDPPVAVQRQLLSGGTCEATAFAMFGYRVTGVALPLGNYHNAAVGSSIAMESIHLDDFSGAVDLLVTTLRIAGAPGHRGPEDERARYEPIAERLGPRLEATAGGRQRTQDSV